MCYSAQVWSDFRKYERHYGADASVKDFLALYEKRQQGGKVKLPWGMDAAFANPRTPDEKKIHALIEQYNAEQTTALEQELFKQVKRLNDAERTLKTKETKKALDDQRIATNKIAQGKAKLADLKRTSLKPKDHRIYPAVYAPVMCIEDGKRVVKPMRYQCRPCGKSAKNDVQFPGTYNARRDSLGRYWKGLFGYSHGVMVVDHFYENVEGEDGANKVLQFTPKDGEPMLVACLWSHWTKPGEEDLLSFAAITDEPTPEVAAAGHDRLIVSIREENLDAWLNPDPSNLEALHAIFDDRKPVYYEHRLAA